MNGSGKVNGANTKYLEEAPEATQDVDETPKTDSISTPKIPEGWTQRVADNGKGMVYQQPGSTGNANVIRIMQPTSRFPNGYARLYNSFGQPVDLLGKPGTPADTHIPLDFGGDWPEFPYN